MATRKGKDPKDLLDFASTEDQTEKKPEVTQNDQTEKVVNDDKGNKRD